MQQGECNTAQHMENTVLRKVVPDVVFPKLSFADTYSCLSLL